MERSRNKPNLLAKPRKAEHDVRLLILAQTMESRFQHCSGLVVKLQILSILATFDRNHYERHQGLVDLRQRHYSQFVLEYHQCQDEDDNNHSGLYQLSRADGHCSCVFRSNPELDSVKKGQVLQERSAFGQHLASILAFPPIITRVSVSSV